MHSLTRLHRSGNVAKCIALLAFGLSAFSFNTVAQPAPVTLDYFGLHIHRADAGTAWPNIPFGSWRLWDAYVGWRELQPTRDRWDFSRLDLYVAMAALTKTSLVLPLAMTPAWASARPDEPSAYRPGNSAEPKMIEDWRRYVEAVGRRYRGKIQFFEIWNEPNAKDHYTGTVEKMVELTCEAYRVLKAIDPDIRVISPGVVGATHVQYLERFLAAGGKSCFDIVAYHFYVQRFGPEAMVPVIREVRAIMRRHGVHDKPLWNTETGWWIANGDGTPDHPMVAKGGWRKLALEPESGDFLMRAFLLARAEGVERFFLYSWDNPYGLGMIEPTSGKPKPMVERWRSTVESLVGATNLKCDQDGKAWRCTFITKNGLPQSVSWTEDRP